MPSSWNADALRKTLISTGEDTKLITVQHRTPVEVQEEYYKLPYHWFPKHRLKWYEAAEKRRIIFDLIDRFSPKPPARLLDAGCGDGKWTVDIREHLSQRVEVFGVDFSERAIAFARLITPDIDFAVESVTNLSATDATFDLATCIEVIEHLPDDQQVIALRELKRVLKPDGLLIITVPSVYLRMPPHHFRHYTAIEMATLLLESGFEVLQTRGQSLPWYGKKRKLRSYAGKLPFVWQLWKFTYREVPPEKATNLLLAARPVK